MPARADQGDSLGPDRHTRDVESLDKYALERWEVILHFMVGCPSAAISQDLSQLLIQAGLMRTEAGDAPCITSAGFQFLLLDAASSLWDFTLQYLNTAQTRGMDLVEILSFLLHLCFSTLGRDYSVEGMSESLLTFLQHLREFGLVFQRNRKSRRYYPTRLAITLSAGVSANSSSTAMGAAPGTGDSGFIIVETNYHLLIVTLYMKCWSVASDLEWEMIMFFCFCAFQILHFLRTRGHPVMLKQNPVLPPPPTTTGQIRLWELERDRLQFSEGVLSNQCLSQADSEVLRDRAQNLGCLVWQNVGELDHTEGA
ncbi:LOW QUALITY PROTEIN: general transcription factor IIH subunit 4 [Coregonus clupeaformis]|uniref:LOW QUALITY PROTEIN: general transcription factor IIH subunit 4 n=1 Tax=Coregonus clupeaformis TaxID=59861 RepID=UPI001E1C25E5|nr:LOW QUALITY PROTEIN: general transcription factor IIH subunit 4 [Coregonus clupeaformis]